MKYFFVTFCCLFIQVISLAQNTDNEVEAGLEFKRQGLYDKAFNCFEATDRFQNILGQYYMAECYNYGYGVTKDDKKAFQIYRRLAERGLPIAQAQTAYSLFKGRGTRVDKEKGCYWLEKATNYDRPDAYTVFIEGLCYEEGLGKVADITKAIENFRLACSKNIDEAFIHLALLYAEGSAVSQNTDEALAVINEAINKIGSVADYACLGKIYLNMGDLDSAKKTWNDIATKSLYFAVNSNDDFSNYMRTNFPIPQVADKNLYANNKPKVEQEPQVNIANQTHVTTHNVTDKKVENSDLANNYSSIISNSKNTLTDNIRSSQSKPFLSDIDTDLPTTGAVNENTIAIIICNENYQDVAPVPFAHRDGESFAKYCNLILGIPKEQIRLTKDATFNNIRREVNWLKEITTKFGGDAKVIFYYAGHGIPDESTKSAYLLPVDGSGSDVSTGYSLAELYKILGDIPAEAVTVFIDACFSGAQRDNGMLASARGVAIKVKPEVLSGKVVVFSAAQSDETAYPYKEQGHGLFTYFLLKKLKETSGNASIDELNSYVTNQVGKKSLLVNGKSQTPIISAPITIGDDWKSRRLK